jgi:hypothetical protein
VTVEHQHEFHRLRVRLWNHEFNVHTRVQPAIGDSLR